MDNEMVSSDRVDTTLFESSLLREGTYFHGTKVMRLTFQNGTTREYRGVERAQWVELSEVADSPGRYFNQCIRPFFTAHKVEGYD